MKSDHGERNGAEAQWDTLIDRFDDLELGAGNFRKDYPFRFRSFLLKTKEYAVILADPDLAEEDREGIRKNMVRHIAENQELVLLFSRMVEAVAPEIFERIAEEAKGL